MLGKGGSGRLGNDAEVNDKDHPVSVVGEDDDDPVDGNGDGNLNLGALGTLF